MVPGCETLSVNYVYNTSDTSILYIYIYVYIYSSNPWENYFRDGHTDHKNNIYM